MKDLSQFGYEAYKQTLENQYTHKTLWQKKVKSKGVCDSGYTLYIGILEYQFDFYPIQYEVGITAERNKIWYRLQAYYLDSSGLYFQLKNIENNLIKMFNLL